jgi:PhnB protein
MTHAQSTTNSTQKRPSGYTAVTPWIIGRDTAGLLEFLKVGFGAEEIARIPNADGGIGHAETRIGDAVVMAFDSPRGWPETPAFIRLYVDDADASLARALKGGATEITRVTALAFGDRVGRVRDPFGNVWWLQTHVEDVAPDEMNARWADPKWAEAMAYVQRSLEEALRKA